MSEIKIGEYVRFKNGELGKVLDIKENPLRVVYSKYGEIDIVADIIKHSFNIIDLIEAGDLCVMDEDIVYIYDEGYINTVKEDIENGHKLISIVTLQQLENIAYKVEE